MICNSSQEWLVKNILFKAMVTDSITVKSMKRKSLHIKSFITQSSNKCWSSASFISIILFFFYNNCSCKCLRVSESVQEHLAEKMTKAFGKNNTQFLKVKKHVPLNYLHFQNEMLVVSVPEIPQNLKTNSLGVNLHYFSHSHFTVQAQVLSASSSKVL